jgi:OmpA-OmpF porin, OOP family
VRLMIPMFLVLLSTVLVSVAPAEQTDTRGCQDHPLFTRMPTYWIHHCSTKEFDAFAFPVALGKTETVEGRVWSAGYRAQATATSKPSELQIRRNYENAVVRSGGKVVYSAGSKTTFRIAKDGKEYWVYLLTDFTSGYTLTVLERAAMNQDVEANAGAFAADLKSTGHVAVYGIYFDTGKTDLKPESQQAIGEIAKLLQADPALRLYVVGNTDNVGTYESNLKLSQGRADAVVAALTGTHGIAAARLRACGIGPLAPVAPNDAEDGRAKNRRVELVRQ